MDDVQYDSTNLNNLSPLLFLIQYIISEKHYPITSLLFGHVCSCAGGKHLKNTHRLLLSYTSAVLNQLRPTSSRSSVRKQWKLNQSGDQRLPPPKLQLGVGLKEKKPSSSQQPFTSFHRGLTDDRWAFERDPQRRRSCWVVTEGLFFFFF